MSTCKRRLLLALPVVLVLIAVAWLLCCECNRLLSSLDEFADLGDGFRRRTLGL